MTDHRPARSMRFSVLVSTLLVLPSFAAVDRAEAEVDPSLISGLSYRSVGPHRGGRATTGTGVVGQPHTFYFGSTGGGVWKTEDAGETWKNLTDGQIGAGGIGAIAVAPSDPNVLYVGTGSSCIRGNVSPGVGAYRSTDSGVTWQAIGLEDAGQIGEIVVHPTDPDLVYAAVLGNAFAASEERGVFRSKDGGITWEKVLYLSENTGVPDLAMDPSNPRVIYAAAWGGALRKPWDIRSGSEDGGIYRSTDSGDTWNRVEGGLPAGVVGKTAVAVSPAEPSRVFALVEHEKGGLYRSDDRGRSWKLVSDNHMLWERPWYYMHITPDPHDADTVWVSNVFLMKSVDGGKSFEPRITAHLDNHGLWINPDDTDIMLNVNDGGASVTLSGGKSWSTQRNQATAELYRVSVDDQFPYRLYGAQQDNSTISVPSRLPPGMVSDHEDEFGVGGCESGHIAVDPRNPDIIYAGCYGGSITRLDRKTGLSREIIAYPQLQLAQKRSELKYRYQWNAPIRLSPHDPDTLYHTSQFVHRSRDEGHSWEVISPDLTTNNPDHQDYAGGPITQDGTGVEVYGTIFSFEESPREAGLLWAGSDDGRLHVSRDHGESWSDVTPADFPAGATVNTIDVSPHGDGRVLVAAFRYREGDLRPYIFVTGDYGATWRSLADGENGIPADHFVRVVREDPDRKGLLYAGTEFGMYVSFDEGETWQSLQLDLPVTPVTDLQVHRKDLVLSTQGRSFWILDDITPLHAVMDGAGSSGSDLVAPRNVYRLNGSGGFAIAGGRRAEDAPKGVVLDYFLPEELEGPVTLTITGPDGETVETLTSDPPPAPLIPLPEALVELARSFGIEFGGRPLAKNAGHNRHVWNMRYAAPKLPLGAVIFGFLSGKAVLPGTYEITLSAGDESKTRGFEILPDPRGSASHDDMRAQLEFLGEVEERIATLAGKIDLLRQVRKQSQEAAQRLGKALGGSAGSGEESDKSDKSDKSDESDEEAPTLLEQVQAASAELVEALTAIESELVQTKSRSLEDPLNYPGKLTAQLAHLHVVNNSGSDSPPTEASRERLSDLDVQLGEVYARLDSLLEERVTALNDLVAQAELPAILIPPAD